MPGFGSMLSVAFEALVIIVRTWLTTLGRVFKSPPPPNFRSEVVLVTGAAQGLGKAIAFKFAEYGASTLVLWDVQESKLRAVRDELSVSGRKVFSYAVDCSKPDEVHRAAERVREEVGHVTVLVNNAGVLLKKPLLKLKDAEIEKTFQVNSLGYIWTVREFLPAMMEMNRGHFVFISSVSAFLGGVSLSDYAASKAAVLNFAQSLHAELLVAKKTRVGVSCIAPWVVNTPMANRPNADVGLRNAIPILEPDYVAERITRAVVDKELIVAIPWRCNIFNAMNILLPSRAMDVLFNAVVGEETLRKMYESS